MSSRSSCQWRRGDILLRARFLLCLVLLAAVFSACAQSTGGVIEEYLALPVVIHGHRYTLDTLVVRPDAPGRYPLALIAQGSSSAEFSPQEIRSDSFLTFAHDFAHRGWIAAVVMWRGYGTSSGGVMDDAGSCRAPEVGRFLSNHADDLQAAMISLAHRQDVDATKKALVMGLSIGGVSALAVAGRVTMPPIGAAINVSGGVYMDAQPFKPNPACHLFYDDLVIEMGRSATRAAHPGTPTLWLYAVNDPWFSPQLVWRMISAWRTAGGLAELKTFAPFQNDGHKMMLNEAGRRLLMPEIDHFLRAHGFPTWDERPWASFLTRLNNADRGLAYDYLRSGTTEKALARGSNGQGFYWYSGAATLAVARDEALKLCQQHTHEPCSIIAENFQLLAH